MSIKKDFQRQDFYTLQTQLVLMESTKSLLLQLTGERPVFKIIDFLIENKGLDFSKKEIANGAGISKAALFNYWPIIETQNIVTIKRTFGKTKLYALNNDSPITIKLLELEAALIKQAMMNRLQQIKIPITASGVVL